MKQMLSVEQSAELIKRGVSPERATRVPLCAISTDEPRWSEPIFTLADLLSLLPKSIEYGGYAEAKLNIYTRPHRRECWVAKYIVSAKTIPYDGAGEELIDALYEVLWKLLDNHVKLD